MNRVNLQARIRRNRLDKLSGTCYVAEYSPVIKQLNAVNKHALVGIQRADNVYTVIGPENVYYSTSSGAEGEIAIREFLNVSKENGMRFGKTAKYEFVAIHDKDAIWVMMKWSNRSGQNQDVYFLSHDPKKEQNVAR